MIKKFKAALFDIDGTILNTEQFVFQAFRHSLLTHRGREITRDDFSSVVGKPLEECYFLLEPDYDCQKLAQTHKDFQQNNLHLSVPFANSVSVLRKLSKSGVKIAAVTTRGSDTLGKTLEKAGILAFFDVIISADDVTNFKPHPEPVQKALEILMLCAEEAVMIGDSDVDILAGKQAGTKTIGAIYGFHGEKVRESNPDYIISDISEVLPLILK